MTRKRLLELGRTAVAECLSLDEINEIEEAFSKIPDSRLSDQRENATAIDMLDEIEQANERHNSPRGE